MNILLRATKLLIVNMYPKFNHSSWSARSAQWIVPACSSSLSDLGVEDRRGRESGKCLLYAMFSFFLLSTIHYPLSVAHASYPILTYRHGHHLFTLDPNAFPGWHSTEEQWLYHGVEIAPPQSLLVDGDILPPLPADVERTLRFGLNTDAIEETIRSRIASKIDRPRGDVTIRMEDGHPTFDGVGFLGRTVDNHRAAELTVAALEAGITDIQLPVSEEQPLLNILDPDLQDMGIASVIGIGESVFTGSPNPRRHNIKTGLSRFNGTLIPQGATFSFNEILGPVNAAAGYVKELVILGDRTMPDYGGGLCQVSTTAYRGIWEYGFPIEQRRNHSFAVAYYAPQGTDATIYPPNTDMKFLNDSPGALLIQTVVEGDNAYFIYYGTRDKREAEIIGPYVWNRTASPPDKTEFNADLKPGEKRTLGKAVPGMQAAWFRIVRSPDNTEIVEPYYSFYQARPNFTQVGIESTVPSWIGE